MNSPLLEVIRGHKNQTDIDQTLKQVFEGYTSENDVNTLTQSGKVKQQVFFFVFLIDLLLSVCFAASASPSSHTSPSTLTNRRLLQTAALTHCL